MEHCHTTNKITFNLISIYGTSMARVDIFEEGRKKGKKKIRKR